MTDIPSQQEKLQKMHSQPGLDKEAGIFSNTHKGSSPGLDHVVESTGENGDPFLVVFDEPYDKDNPKDWPLRRKWMVTGILSATGFNRIMVSTIMAPALSTIQQELRMNPSETAMSLSIYLLATSFGPLVIGPLSEVYGRKPVLHASNVWFLLWNMICGFSKSKQLLISARFLAGFGASAIYALANGVLGDMWRPQDRGRSLGIYLLIPLLGAAIGPIIGGFLTQHRMWRWMFWSTSIFQGIMIFITFSGFHETYEPVILRSCAKKRRHETGNNQYHTRQECEKTKTKNKKKKTTMTFFSDRALLRPLRLLALHPIIQTSALISAFYYGMLYLVLSTFSDLWAKQYGQPLQISGLHYIACALGEIGGSQVCGALMDRLFHRLQSGTVQEHKPESRIPLALLGGIIAPFGLLLYGWSAQYCLNWWVVDIGMLLTTIGMQITEMPIQAYVMESYPVHVSSAMAAIQFLRSLTAFLFPLFAPKMYSTLGHGWGNTILAFFGLFVGLPALAGMWKYGHRFRMKLQNTE